MRYKKIYYSRVQGPRNNWVVLYEVLVVVFFVSDRDKQWKFRA